MIYPRSPRETLGGFVYLPRCLDKIRLHAAGRLPPDYHDNLGQGMDGHLCAFLRLDYEALRIAVLTGHLDDDAAWAWIETQARPLLPIDCKVWNAFATKRGWRDERTPGLAADVAAAGLSHLNLETNFDFFDADEGRVAAPPR